MTQEQKKVIHDIVAEILGLPKNRVIYAYQNAPQITDTFALMRFYAYREEVPTEIVPTGEPGVEKLIAHNNLTLEIQVFTKIGTDLDACVILNNLLNCLDKHTVMSRLDNAGIVIVQHEAVQDISELIDETAFQTRANVDITIRFTPTYLDNVGYIANVKLSGDTGNKLPIDIETE
ncbi:hypothetical protein [Megamonas hypermegale]|uniref:phage neck terminator protein n=1 Tax=Megamonas hypermegale TaxID=158847 RepID=UPI0026EBC12C|nr:hypothetical protein [Megamonas hypermegale]